MANYRLVLTHARYWRGTPHRWSTSHSLTGSAALSGTTLVDAFKTAESRICYSPAAGANPGGVASARLYDKGSGGMPIEENVYFDWEDPGSWTGYTADAWDSDAYAFEHAAEVAMLIQWGAGLSRTGKPVTFRHWLHAVPITNATAGAADISSTNRSTIVAIMPDYAAAATAHGLALGNSGRLASTTDLSVDGYYVNHQMPKGRKRKV